MEVNFRMVFRNQVNDLSSNVPVWLLFLSCLKTVFGRIYQVLQQQWKSKSLQYLFLREGLQHCFTAVLFGGVIIAQMKNVNEFHVTEFLIFGLK